MRNKTLLIVLSSLFTLSPLGGEISYVDLGWEAGACQVDCAALLTKRLKEISAVARVDVAVGEGKARLYWRPNAAYSYQTIRNAISWVGIGVRRMSIKVRGTLSHDAQYIYLTSIGDGTRFQLLNPVGSSSLYIPDRNRSVRRLSPEIRAQFLDYEKQNAILTISGDLLDFYRPPNTLLMENVKVLLPGEES